MFAQSFYHRTIRKYVTYFGTLFNDIYITRDKADGTVYGNLKVPITYGPKQKTLARLAADPGLNNPAAIVLPRMSFEMKAINYSPSRKLSTINKGFVTKDTSNDSRLKYVYNPVPYDFTFSLYAMVKNAEDGTRILEQILPYFTPEWTATLNLIPELSAKLDIPVVIQSVNCTDTYEGKIDDDRTIIWQLDFVMHGYLFGPVKKSSIITLANTNFYTDLPEANTAVESRVTITPGLLANGSSTTNAELTIDRSQIAADDDWGYVIVKT